LRSDAAGQTFPPCRRIRRRTEFEQAFQAYRRSNAWFTVHVRENECGLSRLGVVASKKIMSSAVARNFAKRLIREAFRRDFPAGRGVDIVVRARRALAPETAVQGRSALAQLLQAVAA
jgi:ribonuclease P protein component